MKTKLAYENTPDIWSLYFLKVVLSSASTVYVCTRMYTETWGGAFSLGFCVFVSVLCSS